MLCDRIVGFPGPTGEIMRYLLATALFCAIGAPAAIAVPAASTAPVAVATDGSMIEPVARRSHARSHKRSGQRSEGRVPTRHGRH